MSQDRSVEGYLLAPELLRKLERASLISRRSIIGRTRGERRSARKGSSVEFADFRAYVPGDDLRYLDWSAFARLDRLFLKLFMEEEDLHVGVLVDLSASMVFGAPEKSRWVTQAAAALGYIALCGGDRVSYVAQAAGEIQRSRCFRGKGAAAHAFDWLEALEPGGGTDLGGACSTLAQVMAPAGVVFILSDVLTPQWEPGLRRLGATHNQVCLMHILAPQEWLPAYEGDLRLVDVETGQAREVTIGTSVIRRYCQARDQHVEAVRGACVRYGFSYLLQTTDTPVEDVLLRELRRLQVVR